MADLKLLRREDRAQLAATDPARREAEVTLTLTAATPGRIGVVLDLIEQLIDTSPGVNGELDAPGYSKVFYGWENDQDA